MRSILPSRGRKRLRVVSVGVVTDGDVKIAVWSKVNRARVVIGGSAQIRQFHQDRFAAGEGDVTVSDETAETEQDKVNT